MKKHAGVSERIKLAYGQGREKANVTGKPMYICIGCTEQERNEIADYIKTQPEHYEISRFINTWRWWQFRKKKKYAKIDYIVKVLFRG